MADFVNPKPYEGPDNYIFISYSHMDSDRVMPIVSRLMADGYRVWYDDGINPGTEWPEVIAQHLNNCALFVAFMSNAYMDSFNCKREIDFAVRKRKTFLTVFLEETNLSLGVEMQISTVQSVDYYKTSPDVFHECFNEFAVVRNSGCRAAIPVAQVQQPVAEQILVQPEVQQTVIPQVQPTAPQAKYTQPVQSAQSMQSAQPAQPAQPAAKSPAKKRFIPLIILGFILLLAVIGAAIMIPLSRSGRNTSSKSNSHIIELTEEKITERVLRKQVKGKDLYRITLKDCTLSGVDPSIWSEILTDKITEITITGCQLTDADAKAILDNAPGVKTLNLSNNQIHKLSFTNNTKLERVDVSNNLINEISVTNWDKLNTLNVDDNQLSELGFLQSAIHLNTLSAANNNIITINYLKNCALLKSVNLSHNQFADANNLAPSKETLEVLNLAYNDISDIDELWPMPALKKISLDHNQLKRIYLTESVKLNYLSARDNQIDSFNAEIAELTYLDLANNNLSGDYYFTKAEKLKTAFFENNKITELFFYGAPYSSGTFVAYNNPLQKFDVRDEQTSYNLYLSYNDDYRTYIDHKIGMHLYLLDCPYDSRVDFEKGWGKYSLSFLEREEMTEQVEALRKPI